MSRTTQGLSLGWLDFSEEDRRRAKEYLSQFNAENTLDAWNCLKTLSHKLTGSSDGLPPLPLSFVTLKVTT
jgi:hypothetical protein